MTARWLAVTIDTEVDCDRRWRVSNPPAFRSVLKGIPKVLTPLFEVHGAAPTYLLSAEVLEEPGCVDVLRRLDGRAELGAHLHAEFVEPQRRLFRETMGGAVHDALQRQYPREVEAAKLERLTQLFEETLGRRPASFRAGRYGMSGQTLAMLAALGYRVDSSVTPGLRWDYPEGVVDYRGWSTRAGWVETAAGSILELPITIRPAGRLSAVIGGWPRPLRTAATRLFGRTVGYRWLRPSWAGGEELIRFAEEPTEDEVLVMMLHSTEVIAGASPYAATEADVQRIIGAMDAFFRRWRAHGYGFCTMTDAATHIERVGEPVAA